MQSNAAQSNPAVSWQEPLHGRVPSRAIRLILVVLLIVSSSGCFDRQSTSKVHDSDVDSDVDSSSQDGDGESGDDKSGDDKSGDDKSGDDKSGDDKSGDDKSGGTRDGVGDPDGQEREAQPATDDTTAAQATQESDTPGHATKTKESLFGGWPDPKLVLTFSGRQYGYIEPCGCTGLANQKGGLARRHTFLEHLRKDRGWDVLPLDLGNQIRRFGPQAELKFQMTANALEKLGYGAIGFGKDDLQLSIGELGAVAADDGQGSLFTSANVAILLRDLTPMQKIVATGGLKVGVVAFLGDKQRMQLEADEVIHVPAIDGIKLAVANLKAEGVDVMVLLAHADMDETRAAIEAVPGFELVVTAGGGEEPPYEAEKLKSGELLVQIGAKGMFIPTFGFYPDEKGEKRWKYERVPLDDRFEDSQDMLDMLAVYQDELKRRGLEGLEVRPLKHTTGRTFLGSAKCGECHDAEYEKWQETTHAHATQSLVKPGERSEISRHFDPECLSCHVTGWNPQEFFPYDSGYLSLEKTPLMLGNGCENCHGPGSEHVAAEEGDAVDELLTRLRKEMRLPLDAAEKSCMTCHDHDNSPDFHDPGAFEKYWKVIEH